MKKRRYIFSVLIDDKQNNIENKCVDDTHGLFSGLVFCAEDGASQARQLGIVINKFQLILVVEMHSVDGLW